MCQATNQFAQLANCVHALRILLETEPVVSRYFISADKLYENIAKCANELRVGPSKARNDIMAVINAWKQAADKKISDYGAITVGNHAAGVAASAAGLVPIVGQVILLGHIISHAACGPEIERRREAVKTHFDEATKVLQGLEYIRGAMFIVTSVGNLPRGNKRYDEIGPGIFGLVNLLAQQKQHWSAGLVKEQIEAISEISPRKMPGLSPWKATNGTFKLDLERIADSVRLSQLRCPLCISVGAF
ncbi:hypothetical protein GN244_ATG18972 [Phytophthora infestans]|uniref:Uncharacterized protein n=1 Tax=Phytophthora infestans TaxID=4787 RepID=A0A833W5G3_PHYIN|nr:hypothetical protein GN244_ATG18972 [Phytophthora infestans]